MSGDLGRIESGHVAERDDRPVVRLEAVQGSLQVDEVDRVARVAATVRHLLGDRFLLAAGLLALLLSWVTTNGENLLFHTVQESAPTSTPAKAAPSRTARSHTRFRSHRSATRNQSPAERALVSAAKDLPLPR